MFGDKSYNIFWNIIKSQKGGKERRQSKHLNKALKQKRYSVFFEQSSNPLVKKRDLMGIIEQATTYKKICLLQVLLKEMKSIKERFEDNKKDMLEKITRNCFNYYKSRVGMKEIFDYCKSDNPEIHLNYKLVKNCKEKFVPYYDIIYQTLFLLREDNDIMLNIVKHCPKNCYEQLSDFLVNFFYENTINSSFNEEELMVIIYLIIEDLIINKLPKSVSAINNNIYNDINNSILYHSFRALTRKADVRNFTCTILTENLLKLEGYNEYLSVDIKKIAIILSRDKNIRSSIYSCNQRLDNIESDFL